MLKQFFILTFKSIRYRSVRSWLTILGIVIGIMLVVVILALGDGIQAAVARQLQMFGSNLVVIFPGKATNPLAGFLGQQKFRERDLLALENIPGVDFVVPMEVAMFNIDFKGEKKSVMIHAAPWNKLIPVLEGSQGVKLANGRWPTGEDAKEVTVGYLTARSLFDSPVRIGDGIIIKTKRMKIVGSMSEVGNQMDDNIIYISMKLFRDLTGSVGNAGSAFVKIQADADVNIVAQRIRSQLERQEVVEDFSVLTPEKADRLVGGVLTVVELALVFIALVSLIVGAVGIMNTMYTSVLERTRQIGVMKAIGANEDAILSLFLIESGIIGLTGGVIGIIFGIFVAYLVGIGAAYAGVSGLFSFASLDFFGFFVILLITFIVGMLAGILPARKAAKMEPAEALRYE